MRLFPLVILLSVSVPSASFAQPPAAVAPSSVCGDVHRADTHQPVAGAFVYIDTEAASPQPPQTTGVGGSFCFRDVPPGSYALIPYKTGLLPTQPFAGVTVHAGQSAPPTHLSLTPALPVTQAPADALHAAYTPQQRLAIEIESAAFSPDGKYLAFVVSNIITGDPEQAWRYDLATHQLLAITATPTEDKGYFVDGIAWVGDTLYTAGTELHGSVGVKYFVQTVGDTTSPIPSLPPEAHMPVYDIPRKVGPYSVDGTPVTGAVTDLSIGPGSPPFMQVYGEWWVTLDSPAAIFSRDWNGSASIAVYYVATRHKQHVTLPIDIDLEVLAVQQIATGFRVAYSVQGACALAEPVGGGIDPLLLPHNGPLRQQGRAHNLCFVDLPEDTTIARRQSHK